VVKKRNLPPLLSFSALLVCILPHCRLRDWCGNLRKANGHVVCRLDQSASFHIFDSTFYFPHSAIPHFTHSLIWQSIPFCCSLGIKENKLEKAVGMLSSFFPENDYPFEKIDYFRLWELVCCSVLNAAISKGGIKSRLHISVLITKPMCQVWTSTARRAVQCDQSGSG